MVRAAVAAQIACQFTHQGVFAFASTTASAHYVPGPPPAPIDGLERLLRPESRQPSHTTSTGASRQGRHNHSPIVPPAGLISAPPTALGAVLVHPQDGVCVVATILGAAGRGDSCKKDRTIWG